MLAAAIAVVAAPVFAQDEAPTLGGLHGASGSVEFSFGDSDIGNDTGFGFGSGIKGSTTGSVTASIATEKVEAGATISLVPSVALNENDNTVDTDDINLAAYDAAIEWYKTAEGDNYGPFTVEIDWEAEIYAALQVQGFTLAEAQAMYTEDDGWDIDGDDIADAADFAAIKTALNSAILTSITDEIDALNTLTAPSAYTAYGYTAASADATRYTTEIIAGEKVLFLNGVNQNTVVTDDEADVFTAVNEATDDYTEAYGGVDGDDTYDVTFPVSDAYFRLLGVAGVVDVEFEVNGKNVMVGSKFTEATDDDPLHLGVGLALTSGVVEGLSASILYTNYPSEAADTDDILTIGSEAADAEDAVNAIQVNAGYATDMFNVAVDFALASFSDIDPWFSVRGGVSLADLAGLAANVEFTKQSAANGMGLAADVSASILGISPSVDFRYNLEGDTTTDTTTLGVDSDDTTGDGTALDYFKSVLTSGGYLGIGLSVDFAEIMGMSLITLDGGFAMVFGGDNDWNVGLGLDFTELFAPVTLDAGFSSTYDAVRAWDVALGAEFFGVTAKVGLGDDLGDADTHLLFNAGLGYTYDAVALSADFGIDADNVKSLMFKAKTSF